MRMHYQRKLKNGTMVGISYAFVGYNPLTYVYIGMISLFVLLMLIPVAMFTEYTVMGGLSTITDLFSKIEFSNFVKMKG